MNYSDLKQYTINGLPVLTWGCRVLLRDVLALAGYSNWYYLNAKCDHVAHDAPDVAIASGLQGGARYRVTDGARWTTILDLIVFRQRAHGTRAGDLADAIDSLDDLLTGKRDPFDNDRDVPTIPAPADVEAQPVEIPSPAGVINGRYTKTLNALLGKVAHQLKTNGDALWLNGTVTIPVPNAIPEHIRQIMSEDVAKALEDKGWSVDVQKTTSDGGTSLALDVSIDRMVTS